MGPVVCCLDDSDGARRSLTVAQELASLLGSELVLVHVEPPTAAPGVSAAPRAHERLLAEERFDGESLLERLATDAGLGEARRRTVVGPTAPSIVSLCEEEQAAFVVIGSRGRGEFASALLGSVSTAVAATAPCPCVVVSPAAARHRAGSRLG